MQKSTGSEDDPLVAAADAAVTPEPPKLVATGTSLPSEGIEHNMPFDPYSTTITLPEEVRESVVGMMKSTSGINKHVCDFGRSCKMPTCDKTHHNGREIEENPDLLLCKHSRKCKRKDCFYIHLWGKEIDTNPALAICMIGRACKRWGCCFEHPDGREIDEKGWCIVCGEEGHNKWECTKVPCKNCGQLGHRPHQCPRLECRVCGEEGHKRADCPHARNRGFTPLCRTCSDRGHVGAECVNIQCHKCGEFGHRNVDCPNPGGIATEEGGLLEDMQTFAVHIDELDMPRRPTVDPKETDVEVWVDPLPDPSDLPAWIETYGETDEVFRLPDPATGEPWDRGYVRFKTHESAKKCVEAGAGSWSESERVIKSQRVAEWSGAYFFSLVGLFVGQAGEGLKSLREELGAKRLLLRGRFLTPETSNYQVSTRFHFICMGPTDAIEKLQPTLERRLAEIHMILEEKMQRPDKRNRGKRKRAADSEAVEADEDESAPKKSKEELNAEAEAWFDGLPDVLTDVEENVRQALHASVRRQLELGYARGWEFKFSHVAKNRDVQQAKKALALSRGVSFTSWVERRLKDDFKFIEDHEEPRIRLLRHLESPPAHASNDPKGDHLAWTLMKGLAHLDPETRGLNGVRLSLVSALDYVKDAKKDMFKGLKLAQWISSSHPDKLSVKKDAQSGEDMLFRNPGYNMFGPGPIGPPPPPPMGPPPGNWGHMGKGGCMYYGRACDGRGKGWIPPPPPGPPPGTEASPMDFLESLPQDRLVDQELTLRGRVVELLKEHGGKCLLATLCRDKELQKFKGILLPRGVLLRDWIEMRIGEEVVLEQGQNRAYVATLAEGVGVSGSKNGSGDVPEEEVELDDEDMGQVESGGDAQVDDFDAAVDGYDNAAGASDEGAHW